MNELQQRIERVRTASKLSAEYWSIRTADGIDLLVYLCPPGDLARLRQHYHGCNGVPMTKAEWLEGIA